MRTHSEAFQFEKELEWENPAPGIRRQMMGYDGQLMMVKVEFEKGAVGAMHRHYHGYYVEPDQPHGCVCLEAGVLIDTFSPMRSDFLS